MTRHFLLVYIWMSCVHYVILPQKGCFYQLSLAIMARVKKKYNVYIQILPFYLLSQSIFYSHENNNGTYWFVHELYVCISERNSLMFLTLIKERDLTIASFYFHSNWQNIVCNIDF